MRRSGFSRIATIHQQDVEKRTRSTSPLEPGGFLSVLKDGGKRTERARQGRKVVQSRRSMLISLELQLGGTPNPHSLNWGADRLPKKKQRKNLLPIMAIESGGA